MALLELLHGDCRAVMAGLPAASVDAVVCDPPYGLEFMGKDWDHGVPGVAFWSAALRVAKPGAHLLAFGGTRTFHRLAVAIEDAGWEIRDTVMWVYGSGFPKSHDVGKAIDKAAGAVREVVGTKMGIPGYSMTNGQAGGVAMSGNVDGSLRNGAAECAITSPATEAAKQWQGWGTALKPAWEPIIMARKPLDGTVAQNVQKWGVGAINIDGCRVGSEQLGGGTMPDLRDVGAMSKEASGIDKLSFGQNPRPAKRKEQSVYTGRWPANLIHDGSDEVVALFPQSTSSGGTAGGANGSVYANGKGIPHPSFFNYGDTGSTARFFYCAKANKSDRNEGLEEFDLKREADRVSDDGVGGDNPRNRTNKLKLNHHPTVKPTNLMRYLCRLVTPPKGVVLDPFTGSGSTGKAAILEGFNFVGIERDAEYCQIANARIAAVADIETAQLGLFDDG